MGVGRALIAPKLEDSLKKGGESKLVDAGAGGEVGVLFGGCCGYLASRTPLKPLGNWDPTRAGNDTSVGKTQRIFNSDCLCARLALVVGG